MNCSFAPVLATPPDPSVVTFEITLVGTGAPLVLTTDATAKAVTFNAAINLNATGTIVAIDARGVRSLVSPPTTFIVPPDVTPDTPLAGVFKVLSTTDNPADPTLS